MNSSSAECGMRGAECALPACAGRLRAAAGLGLGLGVAGVAWSFLAGDPNRAWAAVLMAMAVCLWLGVGALFFLAVHGVVGARWTIPLRRVMESLTGSLWPALILFAAIAAFGLPYLYDWAFAPARAHLFRDPHGSKAAWMAPGRFAATGVLAFALLLLASWRLRRLSLAQDGGAGIEAPYRRWSVAALLLLAPAFTLLAWDALLSLHVTFVSALWGGYCFAGAVQSFLAVLILATLWLRRGPLAGVQAHTLHDLGTWMVGWSCVVAYLSYAQYTIVYYANLDEEVQFFLMRSQHGWQWHYLAEAILRWALPFALLMSQRLRAHPGALAAAAVIALAGNWLDLSWIVQPAFIATWRFPFDPRELGAGLAALGAVALVVLMRLRRDGALPAGDPALERAMNGEHLHG